MLIPIPAWSTRGVQRIGLTKWRANNDDPQFVFRFPWRHVSHLVIELNDASSLLDPCLYVDNGFGFEPSEEIALKSAQNGVYAVALKSFGAVRRIRFDPSSFPSEFRLRARVGFTDAAVRGFIGRTLRAPQEPRSPELLLCEIVAAKGDSDAHGGGKATKFSSVRDHFEQVIGLASTTLAANVAEVQDAPSISFLCPVFDAPRDYLDALWDSFKTQHSRAWELILCDDGSSSLQTIEWLRTHEGAPSLRILRQPANSGIAAATNAALAVARGEWVSLIDHDDALAPCAVDKILEAVAENPQTEFLYTDEAISGENLIPRHYFFKPAFDPVLLSGVNYINHLSVYRRDRLLAIGGLRQDFEGSQDYDLLLRYLADIPEDHVLHLPFPAYIWRRGKRSFSTKFLDKATQNARRALGESYAFNGAAALVDEALDKNLHRLRFDRRARTWPKVSIIIPSRDAFPLISRVLSNLLDSTDYPNFSIVIVDNGSKDPQVLALYERIREGRVPFHADIIEEPFNFSRQINRGVKAADGDYLLLLNNDIETLDSAWLKEMVSCFDYPRTGIVGARLLYPNGSLQHAGVIVGLGTVAGHWFCGLPGNHPGPMGRLRVRQSLAAVTGACMLVSRQCWDKVGEFDEMNFAIAYNDIDFCLRAGRAGYRTVWTPFATLRHHESASRGSDETAENVARFNREKEALRSKYGLRDYIDPAFSPYYGRRDSVTKLIIPDSLPKARQFRV